MAAVQLAEGVESALQTEDVELLNVGDRVVAISPGSSGGPLFNEYGKVIGLTTAGMRDGQNLNFVVSARHISDLLKRRQRLSLTDMRNETQVIERLATSSFSVAARQTFPLIFAVQHQQGAVMEARFTVNGGWGHDLEVALMNDEGKVIINSGKVVASGHLKRRLPAGRYALVFGNRMSFVSSKSVSGDFTLTYYR